MDQRAFKAPAGVLAREIPLQREVESPRTFDARGVRFTERAQYDLTVRLLRKERSVFDGGASLAPYDLAVGWGPMSDSGVIGALDISQSGRFFYWLYWRMRDSTTFLLSPRELAVSAAQIRAIPANNKVASQLARMRAGQLVTLHGYLVDIDGPNGFTWATSLNREDTADGARELMSIESIEAP